MLLTTFCLFSFFSQILIYAVVIQIGKWINVMTNWNCNYHQIAEFMNQCNTVTIIRIQLHRQLSFGFSIISYGILPFRRKWPGKGIHRDEIGCIKVSLRLLRLRLAYSDKWQLSLYCHRSHCIEYTRTCSVYKLEYASHTVESAQWMLSVSAANLQYKLCEYAFCLH